MACDFFVTGGEEYLAPKVEYLRRNLASSVDFTTQMVVSVLEVPIANQAFQIRILRRR